jgi:hypothetical protein
VAVPKKKEKKATAFNTEDDLNDWIKGQEAANIQVDLDKVANQCKAIQDNEAAENAPKQSNAGV